MSIEIYRFKVCPTGVTTHNPALVDQLNVREAVRRLSNFIRVSTLEIAGIARIVGKADVSALDRSDLVSLNKDLAILTGTKWLDGK